MGDLVAFLAARLAEDEAAAEAACEANWYQEDRKHVSGYGDEFTMATLTSGDAAHIARHDPARALREVAAGRAILALHTEAQSWSWPPGDGDEQVQETLATVVGHLAAVYSDHPDYRQEWAP